MRRILIVKVLPAGGTAASRLGGYITLGRFLLNKKPAQIETARVKPRALRKPRACEPCGA
jgi:hypothetical protein